jgi:hypothetical protein
LCPNQDATPLSRLSGEHQGTTLLSDSNFIFVELAGIENLRSFDGLAVGAFTDMRGKRVVVNLEDFPAYLSNTLEVLESTRTATGELVGLPIDMEMHDHKGGAGWIKAVQLSDKPDVLRFLVDWTEDGEGVIKSNKRRYFSPTFDPNQKIVLGGSLTNWPASRDSKYRMKLRPIELSQQIQEIDMDKPEWMNDLLELGNKFLSAFEGRKPEPPQEESTKENDMPELTVAEFMQTPEAVAELERRADERAAQLLQAEQLKNKVADFAKRITSGGAYGLAVKAEELSAAILALPEIEKVLELVGKIADAKIANFSEAGSGGHKDEPTGGNVPDEIKPLVRSWVAAGRDAAEFFAVNPELGLSATDYNLSEFAKQEEK